ncbi:MAG: hypothetical protein CVV41_13095 [Candidatus Riflebacteria bacterium HGW-Riflebacteria-1]|jgi:tetratricopeptide (TPR) repeat protein/polyferredoxin|nr:MAG: hypothetical protein CVV41_13095 [Candidatus Riflebacteria bacterium HGW-Riflebacteria-1]
MIWAKYRNWLLLLVYVAFFLHVAIWHHWGYEGVGHLGFGELFATFRNGVVTAGTIFTILVFTHAIFFGGLFCGWFCHWGITQDLAAGIMRRFGIKPRMTQLNSKIIPWVWFLIIIAQVVLYWIFTGFPTELSFNPSATPVWSGVPRSILLICMTTLASGFILIFLFGERAFCRSICTFRLWFSWFEKIAPHKVRQTRECQSCSNECTTSCPMGVQVAEEVKILGHVKNQECVKCHICIGACPHAVLKTSFRKNEFHKDGEQIVPPAALSTSISWLQTAAAVIVLVLFGFELGGNISLSLGFIAGFILIHTWRSRRISSIEAAIAALILTGMYFRNDMNDLTSLAKGLVAIAVFLLAARNLDFNRGFEFISSKARDSKVPAAMLGIVVMVAIFLGARETHNSIMFHQANAAKNSNDLNKFVSIMEGCAGAHMNPANAYFDLANAQLALTMYEKAADNFQKSLELSFNERAADSILEKMFILGRFQECLHISEWLIKHSPDIPRFRIAAGNALIQLGRLDEAQKSFAETAERFPQSHDALIALGEVKVSAGKSEEGLQHLEKAHEIAPASASYHLASLYRRLNRREEAEKYYSEAVSADPDNMNLQIEQGQNLAEQQKFRPAIKIWENALEKAPTLIDARQLIEAAKFELQKRRDAILGK